MGTVIWSKMTEEEKYAEWSVAFERYGGNYLSYVAYCNYWDALLLGVDDA